MGTRPRPRWPVKALRWKLHPQEEWAKPASDLAPLAECNSPPGCCLEDVCPVRGAIATLDERLRAVLRDADQVAMGDRIVTRLARGSIASRVEHKLIDAPEPTSS